MTAERTYGINSPDDKVWIGEDVSLERNLLIDPHRVVVARLRSQNGSFPYELAEDDEERFSASMRSRYAQIGVNPAEFASEFAIEAYFSSDNYNNFEFQFPISNLSEAPIFITKGTKLLRFYVSPDKCIVNGELVELVREREVEIDGKEGREWKFVHEDNGEGEEDIVGIALSVKEDNRRYIPRSKEAISIAGNEKEYRKEIDRFLRPISERMNPETPVLWIGETANLKLNERVGAEIERDAYPGFEGNTVTEKTGLHIDSRLVDPLTGWPVRVEIYSPTAGEHVADWVIFKFFNK